MGNKKWRKENPVRPGMRDGHFRPHQHQLRLGILLQLARTTADNLLVTCSHEPSWRRSRVVFDTADKARRASAKIMRLDPAASPGRAYRCSTPHEEHYHLTSGV